MVKSYVWFSEKQCKLLGNGPLEKEQRKKVILAKGLSPLLLKKRFKKSSFTQPKNICLNSKDFSVEVIYSLNWKHWEVSFNFWSCSLQQKWIQWFIIVKRSHNMVCCTIIRYHYFCYQVMYQKLLNTQNSPSGFGWTLLTTSWYLPVTSSVITALLTAQFQVQNNLSYCAAATFTELKITFNAANSIPYKRQCWAHPTNQSSTKAQ